MLLSLAFVGSLLCTKGAIGEKVKLGNVNEFIEFSNKVNSNLSYAGTTVFLTSDIVFTDELSKQFVPIGIDNTAYFNGIFDGQGHAIKNLKVNTSSTSYVGLFGYSDGCTIKNVVIDRSCSIESSYVSDDSYTGSVIGYCQAKHRPCKFENCLNLGSVTFSGNSSSSAYLGGIAGYAKAKNEIISAKNCANYGSVTNTGRTAYVYIGGFVGKCEGLSTEKRALIQNCLNHGKITDSGTRVGSVFNPSIGGIAGYSELTSIESCVNVGEITTDTKKNTGGIVGELFDSLLTHCYWDGASISESCGTIYWNSLVKESPSFSKETFRLKEAVTVGKYKGDSLLSALNAYSDYHIMELHSHWALNRGENAVSFTVNNRKSSVLLNFQVILLPNLVNEGRFAFDGWYTDPECTVPLNNYEIGGAIDLYGEYREDYNNYVITFDTRGGTPIEPITAQYLSVVSLPRNSTKENWIIVSWETAYEYEVGWNFIMPNHDITLYAIWARSRIENAEDLIQFAKGVNKGLDYSGATVLLGSDIEFTDELSKQFESIGYYDTSSSSSIYFSGVFDGQGYNIKNLKMDSPSTAYFGLFGYSDGLTIKNIVIDESCSFESSGSTNDLLLGGVIGKCYAGKRPCRIENNVNMAKITFSGTNEYGLYLGGIIGTFSSSKEYKSILNNCVNYGPITSSGKGSFNGYVGGIVGMDSGSSFESMAYISNCLNYGSVTVSEYIGALRGIGGIVGRIEEYGSIENCVSAGRVIYDKASEDTGDIVGVISRYSSVSHCYWDESSTFDVYGTIYSLSNVTENAKFNENFVLNGTVAIGKYTGDSLLSALNAYSDYHIYDSYSHWALNRGKNSLSFTVNNRKSSVSLSSQVILLPNLASGEDFVFDGWYTNAECTVPLKDFEIQGDTELYGKYKENKYTITFDTRGGTPIEPITAPHPSFVQLPNDITKNGCTFEYWETEYREKADWNFTVPSRNITLYAVWLCTHLVNAEDLIEFSYRVISGTSYSGTTVSLDADIVFTDELSKQFAPIGNEMAYFNGIFDGQGHAIKNLKVNTSSTNYVGLFGYSQGLTIKNVAIDESCSFESSHDSGHLYTGSVIGYCYANSIPCQIENCLNFGSVAFSGDSSSSLSLGGIVGYFGSSNPRNSFVKNCANYGSVTSSRMSSNFYIGGIMGRSYALSSESKAFIQNCLNYGTITYFGEVPELSNAGGIVGKIEHCSIENCVSAGGIVPNTESKYIGSIVGDSASSSISHCYWDESSIYGVYGSETGSTVTESPSFSKDFVLKETVTIGKYKGDSLLSALNAYSDSYSSWALNREENVVSFTVNNNKMVSLNSKVILLPSLANEGRFAFDGWYTDAECTVPLKDFEIKGDTELYGKYTEDSNNYTITFETRDGVPVAEPITALYLSAISLPKTARGTNKYGVSTWETESGQKVDWDYVMPNHDITLYAVLVLNRITDAKGFIEFSNTVNNGASYSGITVLLDSDIAFTDELSKQFVPIGNATNRYFDGVFDGQGHVIKNLKVSSSMEYAGLFGHSIDSTIRNVVFDESCSVENTYKPPADASIFVGGLVGHCQGVEGSCTVENVVNMGSVTFSGVLTGGHGPYVGGIVGYLGSSDKHVSSVKNCANYGPVTHSEMSHDGYVGGVVGKGFGTASQLAVIQNCLNQGTVTYRYAMETSYIGGIAGEIEYVSIENCVSSGNIAIGTQNGKVGSIVGSSRTSGKALHTFWISNINYNASGYGELDKDESTKQVDLGLGVVNELRSYAETKQWSKWVLDTNNASVTFKVGGGKGFAVKSQIIVLPDLVGSSEQTFFGWYKDEAYAEVFTEAEVKSDITLYGKIRALSYVVSFDVNGGDEYPWENILVKSNEKYGYLLDPKRPGYKFLGWYTDDGKVVTAETVVTIEKDHTLHARWSANKYIVTLDVNGGDELPVKEVTVTFGEKYGELPIPNRTGYTFKGWFTEDGVLVVSGTLVMIAKDHILHAEWTETTSEKVEIVFVRDDMTKKDVEDFVKEYTAAKFDIIKLEAHKPEGLRVVVKFAELKDAVDFVEAVRASSSAKGVVQKIGYAPNESFSMTLCPTFLALIFIFAALF